MADIGPKRKIYRGGVQENTPYVQELPAGAAGIIPGNVMVRTATTFTKTGTAAAPGVQIYIADAPLHKDPITYVYASGETVFGYLPRSGDYYLGRVAASQTLAADSPLTMDAAGRWRLAVPATEPVYGYSVFASASAAVDTLIDVRIA